ncbi:membrane protein [Helicobacter pylori]|nr:membrane protein [Helicobacter pylori]
MKHPFLMAILSKKKKKKTELERILFLVFMLFLMKINLKKGFKHFILSLF